MSERRHLDAADLAEAGPPEAVRLPLELVDPNPANPRKHLTEVDALAENIRAFGLLQPVTVRRVGDRYQLLGGHRRRAAFELLKNLEPHQPAWHSIPAVIKTTRDEEVALRMLISGQVHITNWTPKEEAAALEQLVQAGHDASQIGQIVHKSGSWATKRLRVYNDSVLSGFVQSGRLLPSVAEELLPVLDLETKKRLAEQAAKEKWSQDQIKGRVRALRFDRQVSKAGSLTRQLVEILSAVDAQHIPLDVHRDLMVLFGRLQLIAKGGAPRHIPSIEEAQRAAGIKSQDKPLKRGQRRRPGYRPKL